MHSSKASILENILEGLIDCLRTALCSDILGRKSEMQQSEHLLEELLKAVSDLRSYAINGYYRKQSYELKSHILQDNCTKKSGRHTSNIMRNPPKRKFIKE